MKFLLDENLSKKLALFLSQLGHIAFRIKKIHPGAEDFEVLELAVEKDAVLVSLDKDFGELIFKKGKFHKGVIFLRLDDQSTESVTRVLGWFLSSYSEKEIKGNFVTVTEKGNGLKVRFEKKHN